MVPEMLQTLPTCFTSLPFFRLSWMESQLVFFKRKLWSGTWLAKDLCFWGVFFSQKKEAFRWYIDLFWRTDVRPREVTQEKNLGVNICLNILPVLPVAVQDNSYSVPKSGLPSLGSLLPPSEMELNLYDG